MSTEEGLASHIENPILNFDPVGGLGRAVPGADTPSGTIWTPTGIFGISEDADLGQIGLPSGSKNRLKFNRLPIFLGFFKGFCQKIA